MDGDVLKMTRPQTYCAVFGCLNSSASNPDLSFFTLPADAERRSKWLYNICREDLINKIPHSYAVCEIHFNAPDILPGSRRKSLKKTSLPSLNLPDLQKKNVQTSTEAPTLVEKCIQTEDKIIILVNDSCQTPKHLLSDTPEKRKLKLDLLECRKKLKLHDIDNTTGKNQRDTFHKLCDRFLTKELAELVKAQTHLKLKNTGNRYLQNYKLFCLNLYYTSPQAYRLLRSAMCLPCPNTLNKHGIPVTTEINDRIMSILKTKVEAMSDMEKNCSVVIGAMSLKANLFYNTKLDKIIGFQEIDGVQSPEPAKQAVVVMVRGLFTNWKQPVGFALLSECRNYDEIIATWIDKLLEKLFEIGLHIRTFVSDIGSDQFNAAKKRSVTINKPYFFINNRKIYYIFDAPHLMKSVHNNLIAYDFKFQDHVAKYEHITQFYDKDKQKDFRLAHKLTDNHVHPTNFENMKVCYATELLSNSVAAGISTYVDFNVIKESARGTVELINIMNNLFDALNTSNRNDNNEHRRAFSGKESQITFFNEMLLFFKHLKLINPKNGKDASSNVKFIQGFQITITSILLLFEDLKLEGYTSLLTRRLNQDVLENFFEQIRPKNGKAIEPTSRQFISAFQKSFYSNLRKPLKADNSVKDLGTVLLQTTVLNQLNNDEEITIKEEPDNSVKIMSSEYNQLDFSEQNSLFYVCDYLLNKCVEHHDCQILKSYIKHNQNFSSERHYLRYRDYCKNTNSSLLVVPSDDFVEFVEKLEEIFSYWFETEHSNCKMSSFIFKQMKEIYLNLPCPCFPIVYLKKLYIRMRIFFTIKSNNRAFRRRRKYFSVNNL